MKVIIVQNKTAASIIAAKLYADEIHQNPAASFGFATGGTLIDDEKNIGFYSELARRLTANEIALSASTTFNLDQNINCQKGDENQDYAAYMHKNLFAHHPPKHHFIPKTITKNEEELKKECENYERKLSKHGHPKIWLLGIGTNGHIGFNEAANSLIGQTHIENLSPETQSANKRYAIQKPNPTQAITAGLETIMKSNKLLMIAIGESKAQAISKMLLENITPQCPASFLRLHSNATIIIDETAFSLTKTIDVCVISI